MGLAVSRTALRVVALERGRVRWAAERALTGPEEIATALAELAADRPRGFRRVRVAIVGSLLQAKLLHGFPRLPQARLDRAVAVQAARWFLKNGRPLATGAARLEPDGVVLAAAVERQILDLVAEGTARAGLKMDRVGTALLAASAILGDGEHVLEADEVEDRLSVVGGSPRMIRRSAATTGSASALTIPGLDETCSRFFAAYATARGSPSPAFDLGPDPDRAVAARRLTVRLGVVALLLWVAAVAIGVARVTSANGSARRELAALKPALDAAVAVERDLRLADGLLVQVQEVENARSRDADLLSVITHAVPDSAYFLTVRRDRGGRVTMAGVGPSAARILTALGRAPGVVNPVLQGGVTREVTAGGAVERFMVAFTWRPSETR